MAQEALATADTIRNSKHGALLIYVVAFVTGAIVMSFEMLGSRYLNPYFGSGICTWASLISTVLASLTAGYFIGGWLADHMPAFPYLTRRTAMALALAATASAFANPLAAQAQADDLVDEQIRADMLKRPDGQVARIESEYNGIFITKRRHELVMSFQIRGFDCHESVISLRDPDELVIPVNRVLTAALAYPPLHPNCRKKKR